jgi:ABC-2 type transport system permease protein
MLTFAKRNIREILRDPLNLAFGLGFPLVLLLLLSAIQANVPVPLFEIAHLAPGISVFGLSFLTLFSATVISKDRGSALLQRLYTTPMTAVDFILGYTLPMLPLALIQTMVSYLTALCLGLQPGIEIFYAVGLILPVSVLYIAMGLLCGSVFNEKQVGGVCGALLTNLSAWLSGIWFDLELVGGVFQKIANLLPFVHAVELERAALKADWAGVSRHIWWVLGYACVLLILAVSLFLRQMKRQ